MHGDLSQPTLRIRIDNDALTTVFRDGSDSARYAGARDDLTALPYLLRPGADALIIGSGGGPDVITARVAGARRITAVEVNPLIARDVMGTEPFRSYSGDLYRQPGVRLVGDAELRQALLRRLGLLIAVAVVAVAILSPVIQAAVHLPRGARIALTVVLVAPLATLMGMPMPLGIRRLERSQPQILPWAWGVNGAASVLGSALALVIALLSGFNQAPLVGVAAYLGALAIAWRWEPVDHSAGGAFRAPGAHPMSRR